MNADRHLTPEEIAAYWLRKMSLSALLDRSEHLQNCARCREEVLRKRPTDIEPSEPRYEELVDFMEGKLDPIERHELARRLHSSPQAGAELADLVRFREQMNELPQRTYSLEDDAPRSAPSWILPIAAGLAFGLGLLWLISMQEHRSGVALQDADTNIVVRQDGRIPALGALPPDLEQEIHNAIASGKVAVPPEFLALRSRDNVLAGSPSSAATLKAIAPVGTVVENPQPTFRWNPNQRADGYRINLLAKSTGQLFSSPVIDGKSRTWIPEQPLKPNESYEWEVEALQNGEIIAKAPAPPAAEARFVVLPNEKRDSLAKLRNDFGRSHLVMGLAYARAGLVDQARTEFELLARENPESELPKKMLSSLTNSMP